MASSSESSERPTANEGGITANASSWKQESSPSSTDKPAKGPSFFKKTWTKLDLDRPTLRMMVKGAIAPTIGLSFYQASSVAKTYTTVGYLVAIVSILSFPMMPRAKFLQTLFFNLVGVCLATAVALLAIYCAVQARAHTTPVVRPGTGGAGTSGTPSPGAQTAGYNSSASAASAIWLIFQIYLISTIRARNPKFTLPGITWCIFANVSMAYAPQFSTMAQGIAFAKGLVEAFMTGFGIGTGVSLFVFPLTVRKIVFKEMTEYVTALRDALKANMRYMKSLEETDMFAYQSLDAKKSGPLRSPEAEAFKKAMQGVAAMHGKLHVDLTFAKREVALGKLGPDDLQEISRQLRSVMVPIIGLSSVIDIFERTSEERGWGRSRDATRQPSVVEELQEKDRVQSVNDWHDTMNTLKGPFAMISEVMDEGLEHVLLVLELKPRPKKNQHSEDDAGDAEARGDKPAPGEKGFATYLDLKTREFQKTKQTTLRGWCERHGFRLASDFFERPRTAEYEAPRWLSEGLGSERRTRHQRRLYLVLYVSTGWWALSWNVANLR
ncbi:hypothetical protein LTR66_002068 [Elasticomyces elasticus]|nr:hypothetical protein LTR66_002068 [Elasticomyces elasticus]